MANTLVGVYDRISEAQGAYDELLSCGFDRSDLQLSPSDESSDARQAALSSVGSTSDESTDHSFGSGIRRFFHDLFSGNDEYQEHADVYAEAVRRGHYLVTVHADNDEERVQATQVMNRFNPIDIEERAAGWRSRGWTKYDETAPVLNDSEIADERRYYATGPSATMSTATGSAAAGSGLSGTTNASDATIADTSRADATYGVKDTTSTTDTDAYRDRTVATAADTGISGTTAASDMSRSEAPTAARAASVNEMSQSDAFRPEGTAATTDTFRSDTDTSRPPSYATAETSRIDTTAPSAMTDRTITESDTTNPADADMASRRMTATGTAADSKTIPVIQEELQIGKREVQRGGVRVYQRVKETPVDQSVRLHEEHVHVERHPVDRPASEADLSGLKETSFELRETAEEAVVGKTARIVEEVVVSKEASERTQEIHDKVRRTDVEVEQLDATERETSTGMRFGDDDFRQHFQTTYGQTSDRFEDYEPAYRYGSTLAADERFRGHRWDESEEDVHADWESHYGAATPWEKAKNAVRYGWERATR